MNSLSRRYHMPSLSRHSQKSIFDDFFNSPLFSTSWRILDNTHASERGISVTETEASHKISVAAPGLEKKDFNVELKSDVLTVSYDVSDKSDNSFAHSQLKRSWVVPEGTQTSDISAEYKSGVLNVFVAKQKVEEPIVSSIKVK